MKRFILLGFTLLALVAMSANMSFIVNLATWGLTAALPIDAGDSADAIVILSRGQELRSSRIAAAQQLWEEKRAPRLFVSGTMEVLPIVDRLKLRGIPGEIMAGEGCSVTTEENAIYTSAILYPQEVRRIILLTDAPHMLRSLLLFRSVGFTVIPHPIPLPAQWSSIKKLKFIIREYAALAYYRLSGRFRQRSMAEIKQPSSKIFERIAEWECILDRK